MPAYKTLDKATGRVKSWYCSFVYRDYNGQKRRKVKRGFTTRGDALEWERAFLERFAGTPDTVLRAVCENYLHDLAFRLKPTTLVTKRAILVTYVVPLLGDVPVNAITAGMIRKWQQNIMSRGLSATYQHTINGQLSALLNYAVRFYHLPQNPMRQAGSIGKTRANRVKYWTPEQFAVFLLSRLKPIHCCLFSLLFWTGCRVGEALALTANDVDLAGGVLHIRKTYTRIGRRSIVQTPKTKASNRDVALPSFLVAILKDWIERAGVQGEQRLFEGLSSVQTVTAIFRRHATKAGLPYIHVHDLRHSHASLLASMGVSPVVIKERLGHQNIATTIDIYSHLFPAKQNEVVERLEKF